MFRSAISITLVNIIYSLSERACVCSTSTLCIATNNAGIIHSVLLNVNYGKQEYGYYVQGVTRIMHASTLGCDNKCIKSIMLIEHISEIYSPFNL